ncbi:hypothetical protein APHAL10511_006975 [Amanita phalloides]|nr:hypothetical protein APHAL10511_006975 [Amanita phalloides]
MSSSNIPVRRGLRTTRAAAKNVENATARVTRPTTRSKTVPVTAAIGGREPVFTRPPPIATKGKSAAPDDPLPSTAAKTRRGALVEVTKLVTNNDTKSKATSTLKGKEKDTTTAPEKSKPVLVNIRKPLQETRAATRRTTRSNTVTAPTTASASKQQPIRQARKSVVVTETHEKPIIQEEAKPALEKNQETQQKTLVIPPSSVRKRSSNLAEQTEEPPRVSKKLHTGKEVAPALRDDSQLEVDKVATDLIQPDTEPEPIATGRQWTDLDADDWEDPAMASEYVHEICDYWKRVEKETLPKPNYLSHQPYVSWEHRGVLINWLMEIHTRFRFLHETMFLCVNILDRVLSIRVVSLQKLQLVGVACLLVACKYEETCSPSVNEIVLLCDKQYKAEEIIRAEQYVLKAIGWNLSSPGPMGWLRRGSKADEYEEKARTIAKYFLEIGCLEKHLIGTPASLMAASSLWLARLIIGREEWTPNLAHYTTYEEHELIPTANRILNHILQPTVFPIVYKKYASKRFLKCSIYLKNWTRQRWAEGTEVELDKHVEWLKADVRAMREKLAIREGRRGIFTNL